MDFGDFQAPVAPEAAVASPQQADDGPTAILGGARRASLTATNGSPTEVWMPSEKAVRTKGARESHRIAGHARAKDIHPIFVRRCPGLRPDHGAESAKASVILWQTVRRKEAASTSSRRMARAKASRIRARAKETLQHQGKMERHVLARRGLARLVARGPVVGDAAGQPGHRPRHACR